MNPEDLGAYYESILDKDVRKEGGIDQQHTPPTLLCGEGQKHFGKKSVIMEASQSWI